MTPFHRVILIGLWSLLNLALGSAAGPADGTLRLGGLFGHLRATTFAQHFCPGIYVKAGMDALRDALCEAHRSPGTSGEACFTVTGAGRREYEIALETHWHNLGCNGSVTPDAAVGGGGDVTGLPHITGGWRDLEEAGVHAFLSTANDIEGGGALSLLFSQLAEDTGALLVHPLASGRPHARQHGPRTWGAPLHNYFLAPWPERSAATYLSLVAAANVTRIVLVAATDDGMCADVAEQAAGHGVEVLGTMRAGDPSPYTLRNGELYRSIVAGREDLTVLDIFKIANIEGAQAVHWCQSAPAKARDEAVENMLASTALYRDGEFVGNMSALTMDFLGSEALLGSRFPAPRVALQFLEGNPDTDMVHSAWALPWSEKVAEELGVRSALVPGWANVRGFIHEQMLMNELTGDMGVEWGHAAGAAAGELLVSSLIEALRGCELGEPPLDLDALLASGDPVPCESDVSPDMAMSARQRWTAWMTNHGRVRETILGTVGFDADGCNVEGADMPWMQFQKGAGFVVVHPKRDPPSALCFRGLPGCRPYRPPAPVDETRCPGDECDDVAGRPRTGHGTDDIGAGSSSTGFATAIAGGVCGVVACGALVLACMFCRSRRRRRRLGKDIEASNSLAKDTLGVGEVCTRSNSKVFDVPLADFLGSGSYGEVYAGTWYGTHVAIKTMHAQDGPDVELIRSEVALHMGLRHPHVVTVFAWGERECARGKVAEKPTATHEEQDSRATNTPNSIRSSTLTTRLLKNLPWKRESGGMPADTPSVGPTPGSSVGTTSLRPQLMELWILMELCDQGTLHDWIRKGRFRAAADSAGLGDLIRGSDLIEGGICAASDVGPLPVIDAQAHVVLHKDGSKIETNAPPAEERLSLPNVAAQSLPVAEEELLRVLKHIAAGAAYLHAQGIVHGDLKPANVLAVRNADARASTGRDARASLGGHGRVSIGLQSKPEGQSASMYGVQFKLADFGLSRHLPKNRTHESSAKVGTLAYMSPEVLMARQYGPAADVYSFGAIAYEIACSRGVHEGADAIEVMRRMADADWVPTPMGSTAPQFIQDLVVAAMAKDPSLRPTMEDLQRVIDMRRNALEEEKGDHPGAAYAALLATPSGSSPAWTAGAAQGQDVPVPWYERYAHQDTYDRLEDEAIQRMMGDGDMEP